MDMFINMRQFLAVLWTFELLDFDQFFSSNIKNGDKLCTNHKHNYLLEKVLYSKNDKIVTDIIPKPGNKKKIKM